MTARALLVPDCGRGVGLGHLERMLALADALAPGLTAVVVVPEGDDALCERVTARGHMALGLPGASAERAESLAASGDAAVTVLDGYVFDVALQARLRRVAPLVVVDDLRLPCSCHLAVNPSPGGEGMRPEVADDFLGGAAHALLGAAFAEAREALVAGAAVERSVLVSTGAMNLDNISGRVAAELLERDTTVHVVAVAGPDMSAEDDLPSDSRLRVLVAPPTLATALAGSSVYVGAAGTTAVQAACVGVPAVVTPAVANQRHQAAVLEAAGCAIAVAPGELADTCLRLLADPGRRARMAQSGRALVDGRGAQRVAAAVCRLAGVGAA